MSNPNDITQKTQSATKGADCGIESENRAIVDRAYVTHEKVHRYDDRGKLREIQL